MPHASDLDLSTRDISSLTSAEAVAAFLTKLGYDTKSRATLSPEAIGLSGDSATAIKTIELLSEDPEQFLRVVFAQTRSLTAKVRNDLVRVLGRSNVDHLLVLASDFDTLEFVILDKRKSEKKGPASQERIQVVPKSISISRRSPSRLDIRNLRRFTWTCKDALEQFDKLRSVFTAATYTGDYFQNRGLFSDYYLRERLRENPRWSDSPTEMFAFVRDAFRNAETGWAGRDKDTLRRDLFEPLFKRLGFKVTSNGPSTPELTQPAYLLKAQNGTELTAAFVYGWDRWLDGPDLNDSDTPDENPGACVVTALDTDKADWLIVTNGRLWRLYSRQAHARATNFYEIDLVEALRASGDTDPNDAFRYWWLFFHPAAFASQTSAQTCWLDEILFGSREYAKRLGDRLKDRIFFTIFPRLAQGFLIDRTRRFGKASKSSEADLAEVFEATLTLLYRLLFLLYAESRDLLPIREAPYQGASLRRIKEEIASKAGAAESEVVERLTKVYSDDSTTLYERLSNLFVAMDKGDPVLNVPTYNGGLFNTSPSASAKRDDRIATFLMNHSVPDSHLAIALDRLSRDQDERSLELVFIDYKSLEVRHLGSIYEGLLEFRLKLATEDLTTKSAKGKESYIPLSEVTSPKGRQSEIVVRKNAVYLSNDRAERKATGSYYTPDHIVGYIVENTVGPVLDAKMEALRPEFRQVRKTFDKELKKSQAFPCREVASGEMDHRQWAGLQTYNHHKPLVDRLFDLRVLDSAMGSGHFLVEVVDFLTDRLLTFLNQFPINPVSAALEITRQSILASLGDQGVTVDPAKLTDINLLKRHVLKRCIYGVDLNPMAVELAKVSLWLDAFTLGAPLSFLDHHLRCGNSLIGASFKELDSATAATLFKLDYGPLLRAINHVLLLSRLADATSAEVADSSAQYDQARDFLAGYRVVLDLLVAQHFGLPQAHHLLVMGDHLDLRDPKRFYGSLHGDKERQLVAQVESLAHSPDLRFFHWEVEFPEVFFGFTDTTEGQLLHRDQLTPGSAGFDCIVGNPPYDVLAKKELEADLEQVLPFYNHQGDYQAATGGKQNLYKLFLCRNVALLRDAGRLGQIVPMPLLGDEQAAGVRQLLLTRLSLALVEAFPQKDDAHNRVFEEAKLSTCVFVAMKGASNAPFRARVHPGKAIDSASPSLLIRSHEVQLYDPENQAIVTCSQEDWDLATRIMASGRMCRLKDVCTAYQGEVNETTDREKGNVSYDSTDGPEVVRGAAICLYVLRPASQGEAIYLKVKKYLAGRRPGTKVWHHRSPRVGLQESCPQNNFRRIIAAAIPQGSFCNHLINYFPEPECKWPLPMLLALLNSKLADWYFRLGSTNAHVSHYQIYTLPAPSFADGSQLVAHEPTQFAEAITRHAFDEAFAVVNPSLVESPFPPEAMACLVRLATDITGIETARGSIARTERSALALQAQPYQDLIDRILFRMAGLTDSESAGLERRLAGMM